MKGNRTLESWFARIIPEKLKDFGATSFLKDHSAEWTNRFRVDIAQRYEAARKIGRLKF